METVCHYTTIESFLKMVENISCHEGKCCLTFWATSIYAMNDPSEFLYGYNLLKESVLPGIEKELGITENSLKLSNVWNNFIGRTKPQGEVDDLIDYIYGNHETPFIVSFSKKKDFLPMWNTYSNKGRGVCLCFNNKEYALNKNDIADSKILNKLHAMDVSYGEIDEVIRGSIKNIYEEYYQNYKGISDKQQQVVTMTNILITLIVVFSPKHKTYDYEQESRLVELKKGNKDVKYRCSKNGRLIPYIEVNVKLEYLEKIIVGPCVDSESVIRELKNLLIPYNITKIEPSSIPYREY